MSDINWSLLEPVPVGQMVQQGFATGAAMMQKVQAQGALSRYMQNPDDPQALGALAALDPQTATEMQRTRLAQQKLAADAQERQTLAAIGQLATTDPAAASKAAIGAGAFDLAKQINEMSDPDKKRTAELWEKAGTVAYAIKQKSNPQERMAIWQQARPILEAQGASAEMLNKVDPLNDAQLDAAIATSQKISDLVPKAFNVGPGEGRYEQGPDGTIRTIIAPNPGDQPFGAPAGGAVPPPPPGFVIQGGPTPGASGNFP